jgi:hypothetical protein
MPETQIVIGGGLAGLTAAASLARRGVRVRLYEHSHHLGGRAITTAMNGFQFNLGPHALYRNGIGYTTLSGWGITPAGRRPEVGPKHFLSLAGRLYPLLRGPQDLLFSNLFTFREKLDAANALRKLSPKAVDAGMSLSQWLDREVNTEKVRMLVETLARVSTYVNEPALLEARAAMTQIQMAITGGVLYLDDGWQQIVTRLSEDARQHGAEFVCGESPAEIPAGSILAVPPQQVKAQTGISLADHLRAVRMSCLDLGLESLPEGAAQFVLGMDQPYYFSVHSTAAKLTSGAGAVVHVAKYLGSGEPANRAELEDFADLAMPGWRERVAAARFLPEMTVTHSAPWVDRKRPMPDQIAGVFLAGDYVGDSGMLADTSFASGCAAADLALRHNRGKALTANAA